MVEKIGKIILLLFCVWGSMWARDKNLNLRVVDMQGHELKQAEIGVPFVVQLSIKDSPDVQIPDFLPGFEDCKLLGTSSSTRMSMVNGKQSREVVESYTLRCDKKKKITFGPFVDKYKFSNIVQLPVGEVEHSKQSSGAPEVFVRWHTTKKSFFVGEKITLELHLYQQTHGAPREIQRHEADFGGLVCDWQRDHKEYTSTNVSMHGTTYVKTVIPFELHAEKPGSYTVLPLEVMYTSTRSSQQNARSLLALWTAGRNKKTIHSNALSVRVRSLPEKEDFHGIIGRLDHAHMSVKPQQLEVGKACSVHIRLLGDFNVHTMPTLALQGLSDACKVYQAHKKQLANGVEFEYIVQPAKPGALHIPSQHITYFDTATQTYKEKRTTSAAVKVLASSQPEQSEPQGEQAGQKDMSASCEDKQEMQRSQEKSPQHVWCAKYTTVKNVGHPVELAFLVWLVVLVLIGRLCIAMAVAVACDQPMTRFLWVIYFWFWGVVLYIVHRLGKVKDKHLIFTKFLEQIIVKVKKGMPKKYLPEEVADVLGFAPAVKSDFLHWFNELAQPLYSSEKKGEHAKSTTLIYWFKVIKGRIWHMHG